VSTIIDSLSDVIQAAMLDGNVPGISIGIRNGDQVETAAFGIANLNTGAAVVPETLFQIGSISKIFTTTLVMTAVERGELSLDTPVINHVPDLRLADAEARRTITLRHLLTHMSGFYGDRFDDQGRGDDANALAIAAFGDLPQQTKPGELWTYCNAGFDLAGHALERATGHGFEALMRERVFDPLGLTRATYFADEAIRHSVAVGHEPESNDQPDRLRVSSPWAIPRRSNAAGGISTNVAELLAFAEMHFNDGRLGDNRVLTEESARAMRTRQVDADAFRTWGIGWSMREVGSDSIVEHNGATNGQTARLTVIPARRFAIAVLTNHDRGSVAHTTIASAALERLFGLTTPIRPIISLPRERMSFLSGEYVHGLDELSLSAHGNGIHVERMHRNPFSGGFSHGEPFDLHPVSDRVFAGRGGGMDGSFGDFIFNPDGSVRFFRLGGRLGYPKG